MSCGTEMGVKQHKARNEPPCPGCRKFMTNPAPVKAVKVAPAPKRRTPDRDVRYQREISHGTQHGYLQHRRRSETPCQDCKDAHAAHKRAQRAAKTGRLPAPSKNKRVLAPCGTPAARQRHRRNGEEVCEPCRLAYNEARRAKKRGRPGQPAPKKELAPCGTKAAHARHLRHGEKPCEPCRIAYNQAWREQYRARQDRQASRKDTA